MDTLALAKLLFPNVTDTPEMLEERFPARNAPEGAVITRMAPSPTGFVLKRLPRLYHSPYRP